MHDVPDLPIQCADGAGGTDENVEDAARVLQ